MILKNEIKKLKINLPNKIQNVNKIYQLTDIHIRNYKRHTEYQYVFDRVYETLKNDIDNDFIILVTGDVSHSKTDMSPELVQMISSFLKSLALIAPTFVIAGNHDCNLNNVDRLDVLQPIITLINNDNLFYLKDTGIYSLNNYDIDLIVYSVFDSEENYFSPIESTASKKICLYHGVVDGCVLDNGTSIASSHMNLNTFMNSDLVILGDIHKQQTLQSFEIEEIEVNETEVQDYLINGWNICKE